MERELKNVRSDDLVVTTGAYDLRCKQVYHIQWPDHCHCDKVRYTALLELTCHWLYSLIPPILSSPVLVSRYSQGRSFALPANGLGVTQVNLFSGYWHWESRAPEEGRRQRHAQGRD